MLHYLNTRQLGVDVERLPIGGVQGIESFFFCKVVKERAAFVNISPIVFSQLFCLGEEGVGGVILLFI